MKSVCKTMHKTRSWGVDQWLEKNPSYATKVGRKEKKREASRECRGNFWKEVASKYNCISWLKNSWGVKKPLTSQGNRCFLKTVLHLDHAKKTRHLKWMNYHFLPPPAIWWCRNFFYSIEKYQRKSKARERGGRLMNNEWTSKNRNTGTSMGTEVERAKCKKKRLAGKSDVKRVCWHLYFRLM